MQLFYRSLTAYAGIPSCNALWDTLYHALSPSHYFPHFHISYSVLIIVLHSALPAVVCVVFITIMVCLMILFIFVHLTTNGTLFLLAAPVNFLSIVWCCDSV